MDLDRETARATSDMRKFFGLRSSSSEGSSPAPLSGNEKVSPKCDHEEDAPNSKLGRSRSFTLGREANPVRDPWGSSYSPLNDSSGNSQASERHMRSKRGNPHAVRQLHSDDMLDSPASLKESQSSSENSSRRSPVSLKCRADRLTKILNNDKILDLYISGENQEVESRKASQKYSMGDDGCMLDSRVPPIAGRPPRAQSTAPSSPTYRKGNARIQSMRELGASHRLSMQEWMRGDPCPTSPQKHTRRYSGKPLHELRPKARKSRDSDSETTVATNDIYEDLSNAQPTLSSNITIQSNFGDHGYPPEEPLGFQRSSYAHVSAGVKDNSSVSSEPPDITTDEELYEKQKEVEHILSLLSEEDLDLERLKNGSLNDLELLQKIGNIAEDRKYLAFELASQIKCRVEERSSSKERLKQAKMDLDIRTRRLEKEKNEMQFSLEKELDRRSSSWSLKFEKFQSDEQRLRERVRELAEQNVSLQREISALKDNEADTRSRVMNSETQLNSATASLKEMQTENQDLHRELRDLQERFKGAEEECDCFRMSYKQKEKEIKELQKAVVRLQRICSEQDQTINGLRQGYSNEIGKLSVDRGDKLNKLQMEQLRLTEVEQILRKEVESFRKEMESLRDENMCLLDRLRSTGNVCGSSFKLHKELRARVDFLQTQGLSLLSENVHFSGELLGFMKHKNREYEQEASNDFNRYPVLECTVKYQNLRRQVENYRRSLQTVLTILEEKSLLEASDSQSCTSEGDVPRPSRGGQASEDAVEFDLKAETLLTSLLKEKLCSKELEVEQLQSDLASSVRANDVLQTETQRLQDELSCLTHKTKEMQLQILRKDDSINQLEHALQESTQESTATRSILLKVSEERDRLWEQLKTSSEKIMLLDLEATSNKKTIEALDEDIHVKDGQITILEETLRNKPFCIVCSSNSMDRFTVK